MALEKIDFMRYGRQMLVPEIGPEGQLKIKSSRVLVIGIGGLGCPVLQYLAAAGVGCLGAIDFDIIEMHNLHRQILYQEAQIGQPKVQAAQAALHQLNPHINYEFKAVKLTPETALDLIQGYDLVIDGTDNFATRYLVNDTCVQLEIPLIYGSILNFEGQFSVFCHAGSKNLRDIFPDPPQPDSVPGCAQNGVLATLPGIIGMLMAQEALKLLMGLPVLRNEMVLFNTLDWNWTKLRF